MFGVALIVYMVYTLGMANKSQVERKALTTGSRLIVRDDEVALYAPEGFTVGEYHILVRTAEQGWYTKADIYDEMLDELDDIRKCAEGCQH